MRTYLAGAICLLTLAGCSPLPRCSTDAFCVELNRGMPAYCNLSLHYCFWIDAGYSADSDGGDAGNFDSGTADAGKDAGPPDAGVGDAGGDGGYLNDGGPDAGLGDGGCDCPRQTWVRTSSHDAGAWFTSVVRLNDGRVLGGSSAPAFLFHPASETWTRTNSSNINHTLAPTTSLLSGKVLVAGGAASGVMATAVAEIFDPTTGAWSLTDGGLVSARLGHTATRLLDGRVLLAGGASAFLGFGPPTPFAELFAPATNDFHETGQMVVPRLVHAAALLNDGRVLVAAGIGSSNNALSSSEIYSPSTGTWTATGNLSVAVGAATAMVVLGDGRALLLASKAQIFDPDAGSWSETGAFVAPRSNGNSSISSLADGGAIVCGNSAQTTICEVYDPPSNAWKQTGSTSTGRTADFLVLLKDGRILITGVTGESEIYW